MQQQLYEFLVDDLADRGYDPASYQLETNSSGPNEFQITITPQLGLFSRMMRRSSYLDTVDTARLKREVELLLSELYPDQNIHVEVKVETGRLIVRVSHYNRVELPTELLTRILTPGQAIGILDLEDQHIWRQYVNRRFGIDYEPANLINWKRLYRTLLELNGQPSLEQAVEKHSPDLVRILLQDPLMNPNWVLEQSATDDNLEVLKLLLEDPRTSQESIGQAHNVALIRGQKQAEQLLYDQLELKLPGTDLTRSIHQKNRALFDRLIEEYSWPTQMIEALYSSAAMVEDPYFMKVLLARFPISPQVLQRRILMVAIKVNNVEVVKLLLSDPRIRLNISIDNPLLTAIRDDRPAIVRLILQQPGVALIGPNEVVLKTAREYADRVQKYHGLKAYLEDSRVQRYIQTLPYLQQLSWWNLIARLEQEVPDLEQEYQIDPSLASVRTSYLTV